MNFADTMDKVVFFSLIGIAIIAILWGTMDFLVNDFLDSDLTTILKNWVNELLGFQTSSDRGLHLVASLFTLLLTGGIFGVTRNTKSSIFVFVLSIGVFSLIGWFPKSLLIGFIVFASLVIIMKLKTVFT